ncbi:cation transport ATPase [Histoplasma capsulatum var. duboisii H88]|uniref:Cation transport ATPase n=1 Tax=Ajellomyces capsulatus (strain H88) TaxID=544711 RepID=A0A8A1LLD2_AJEC8|nr:cation transport ATPase [Histoplasma capsulatum var. duboisii H88]
MIMGWTRAALGRLRSGPLIQLGNLVRPSVTRMRAAKQMASVSVQTNALWSMPRNYAPWTTDIARTWQVHHKQRIVVLVKNIETTVLLFQDSARGTS